MKKILQIYCIISMLVLSSCVSKNETDKVDDQCIDTSLKPEYDTLVWNSDYTLEYSYFFDSSLENNEKTLVEGSLSSISKYIAKENIKGKLLVVIFSKGTHFDLSDSAQIELAKKIAQDFNGTFNRVIVRNAYSGMYHGVIYDTKKTRKTKR